MSDRPPIVNFEKPYSRLDHLISARNRLRGVYEDISRVYADIDRFEADGARAAQYSAVWAATLLSADIVKHCLASFDPRAAITFDAIDGSVTKANKVLKLFGKRQIATRTEVLKQIDPSLKTPLKLVDGVKQVRRFLSELRVRTTSSGDGTKIGSKLEGRFGFVLDIVIGMTEDTVLLLQAGQTEQTVHENARSARANTRKALDRVQFQINRLDRQIVRVIEIAQIRSRTA